MESARVILPRSLVGLPQPNGGLAVGPFRMANHRPKGWLDEAGRRVSSWVSDVSAHPFAQIGVIVVCGLWFAGGFATDLLTAILSILAITLAQMVLNRQNEREADAHRRDIALHTKIDELLAAMKGARNDFVGIEELEEEDIEELKDEVREAIEEAGLTTGDRDKRAAANRAVDKATSELRKKRSAAGSSGAKGGTGQTG